MQCTDKDFRASHFHLIDLLLCTTVFIITMKKARNHGHAGHAIKSIVETTDIPRKGQAITLPGYNLLKPVTRDGRTVK
jgi:hypothetical protein